jgi:hypothetical protein
VKDARAHARRLRHLAEAFEQLAGRLEEVTVPWNLEFQVRVLRLVAGSVEDLVGLGCLASQNGHPQPQTCRPGDVLPLVDTVRRACERMRPPLAAACEGGKPVRFRGTLAEQVIHNLTWAGARLGVLSGDVCAQLPYAPSEKG